jgi:hypothetical protein
MFAATQIADSKTKARVDFERIRMLPLILMNQLIPAWIKVSTCNESLTYKKSARFPGAAHFIQADPGNLPRQKIKEAGHYSGLF